MDKETDFIKATNMDSYWFFVKLWYKVTMGGRIILLLGEVGQKVTEWHKVP